MFWAGLVLISLVLAGCTQTGVSPSPTQRPPDPDAVILVDLGRGALERIRGVAASAVLRQVNVIADGGPFEFQFTDRQATREIAVTIPAADADRGTWTVRLPTTSKLTAHPSPGMKLEGLRVGPGAVAAAATGHWEGCGIRSRSLTGEGEDVVWHVFCNLPQGVLQGFVDGRTGEFVPSEAPPAIVPPIATAEP